MKRVHTDKPNSKMASSLSAFCVSVSSFVTGKQAAFVSPLQRHHVASKATVEMVASQSLRTAKSEQILTEARELMPGGVSSPVRAFSSVGGGAVVFDRVKGSKAYDIDGNEYIDYIGSWGPAIAGAANEEINAALAEALKKGTSFGAPSILENKLAKMVVEAVPSVEMVRFVNSGTEACMSVVRVMRAFTKREKIIKFSGCYHGHADMYLVQAGSGVLTLGLPDSPGVPKSTTANTFNAKYNDLESVKALFDKYPAEIAGVILEPVVGNSGFIPPTKEFLEGLRSVTEQNDALLCFDEVMTGFRISYSGAQGYFGIKPDLSTFGKVIGGGLPVGAYGGRKDIMSMVAPAGPVYQAGTLSGNPLAMTAGIATLEIMKRPGAYEYLDKITGRLIDGLLGIGKETGHAVCGGHISAMWGLFFCEGPITCFEDVKDNCDFDKFARYHRAMLEQGIYLAPSQYEAGFTSMQHTEEDIDRTLTAARNAMSSL